MAALPSIAACLKAAGIAPDKRLGQNFLLDQNICNKIVRLSGISQDDYVLEIGPGPGGLTRALAELKPASLILLEKDKKFAPILEDVKRHYGGMGIIYGDALEFDFASCKPKKLHVISNLPYNVGTQILLGCIENRENIKSMTFMFQKEVALRILAEGGGQDYGRLSIIAQLSCNIKKILDLPASAFSPKPKVDSSILSFDILQDAPDAKIMKNLEQITQSAFSQRRKMLKSSICKLSPAMPELLNKLGISKEKRPQELTPSEYLAIASQFDKD